MVFTSNFNSARLIDGALTIAGQSAPADGADRIQVTLVHRGEFRSLDVPEPRHAKWTVTFPAPAAGYDLGEPVFVAGVARLAPPDVAITWGSGFDIISEDAPEPDAPDA